MATTMDNCFAGKVISITGAASGIGLATTKLLYANGATVAASDFNPTAVAELESTLSKLPAQPGQRFKTSLVDVSKVSEVNAWIQDIIATFGKLDHAANVAGAGERGCKLAEKTDEDFDFAIGVNLRGVFNCMRAQLGHLSEGSSIVNVGSGSGVNGTPGISLYSAAKAGVNTLTATAAKEYGPKGIRINALSPGVTLTPAMLGIGQQFLKPSIDATPLQRGAQPEEMGAIILFLLSENASYVTGAILRADGGFAAQGH